MATTRIIRRFRLLRDVIFGTPATGDVAQYESGSDKIVVQPLSAEHVTFAPAGTIAATNVQDAVEEAVTEAAAAVVTDHGSLTGLGDNDHPQYQLAATAATDAELAALAATAAAADAAIVAASVNDGDAAGGVLSGTYPNPGFAADMATQAELDAHVNDASDAHDASAVSYVPGGTVAATNVQDAIAEVALEAGASGAPTGADYLVGTAQGALSAEIVVGTSPGGELGGTWASPTVDATHSGSSHSSVQSAAEATAAAALAGHSADTTAVHGIADTSALVVDGDAAGGVLSGTYPNPGFAADMATQAELDAHVNDTSDAHDASAVSVDSTNLLGTAVTVQGSLEELDDLLNDHHARHEDGGMDEIDVTGLDGQLADPQPTVVGLFLSETAGAGQYPAADGVGGTTWEDIPTGGAVAAEDVTIADAANDFTATDVEGALAELQSDAEADATALSDHIADTTAAHAATAIAFTPNGSIAATTVQAAIQEVRDEAGSGSALTVKEDGSVVDATVTTIDFLGADFDVTESPEDEVNVVISAAIARTAAVQPLDSDLTAIAALADPNADRILFWDDSLGAYTYLTPGTNLTITGTTIDAASSGSGGPGDVIATYVFCR